jgi:hypothetical protein
VNSKLAAVLIMVIPVVLLVGVLYFSGKIVDGVTYNCNMLIGGWHPDAPAKLMQECKDKGNQK